VAGAAEDAADLPSSIKAVGLWIMLEIASRSVSWWTLLDRVGCSERPGPFFTAGCDRGKLFGNG
jgi:hypothetical protein